MSLDVLAGAWGLLWAVLVLVFLVAVPRIGRLESASWLFVIAAFLMVAEDAALPFWQAIADTRMDPQGVAEVVHPHVRGHMTTASMWTLLAGVLCGVIARIPLRRGERWAWWALFGGLLLGSGTNTVVALTLFSHGLPLPTVSGQAAGFGWQPIVVMLVTWVAALVLAHGPIFRRAARGQRLATQTSGRIGPEIESHGGALSHDVGIRPAVH